MPGRRADLPQALDDRNDQAPQADAPETIREGTLERSAGSAFRKALSTKVPGSIDARNSNVDGVFQPFCNPVRGKCDKDYQADDFALATSTCTRLASWIITGMVLDVDRHEGDRIPRAERGSEETSDEGHNVNMSVFLRDVDGGPQHQHREWDPRYPRDEAKHVEDRE